MYYYIEPYMYVLSYIYAPFACDTSNLNHHKNHTLLDLYNYIYLKIIFEDVNLSSYITKSILIGCYHSPQISLACTYAYEYLCIIKLLEFTIAIVTNY